MENSLVFISHITEEKELASALKELIEESFLGMAEVFVSSDENSILVGQRWLDSITDSLKNCNVEIILCSPRSIKRPWINFEAGAGWIKGIPVIPLCHSEMAPSNLPIPLNMLQATTISEVSGLKILFTVLASGLGVRTPNVDFTDFIEKVTNFEKRYTFWDKCNEYFKKLHDYNPQLLPLLRGKGVNDTVTFNVAERDVTYLENLMDFFSAHNLLEMEASGGTMIGPGIFHQYLLIVREDLHKIMSDENFLFNN